MKYARWLIIFASVLIAACVSLSPVRQQNIQTYTLNYSAAWSPRFKATPKTLIVGVGQAAPALRSEKMWYQQDPYELKYYALHRWITPPASLITPLFAKALSETGAFKAVVSTPLYVGKADAQIEVALLTLQQNFTENTSEEQLIVQVIIIDAKQHQLIAAKRFEAKVPAAPTPEGGVIAANAALKQLMPQMIAFVMKRV